MGVRKRPGKKATLPPFPKQGAGGAAPAGGTGGIPLFPKTLEGGPGGTTAQAKPDPPLKEGAGHNKTLRSPSRVQGAQPPLGLQRVPRNAKRRPHLSLKGGCREPLVPAGGTGGVPLFPKTLEGGPGGTTALAKIDPPLKEGAGQNKTPTPKQGAGGCSVPAPEYRGRLGWGSGSAQARKRRSPHSQAGCRGRSPRQCATGPSTAARNAARTAP